MKFPRLWKVCLYTCECQQDQGTDLLILCPQPLITSHSGLQEQRVKTTMQKAVLLLLKARIFNQKLHALVQDESALVMSWVVKKKMVVFLISTLSYLS